MDAMRRAGAIALVLALMLWTGQPFLVPTLAVESDFVIEENVLIGYQGSGGEVVIPDGVTRVADEAFREQAAVTAVTLSNSVRTVGHRAFQGCAGLKRVTMGKNVVYVGDQAFSGCTGLEAIEVKAGNSAYSSLDGVLYAEGGTNLVCYPAGKTGPGVIPITVVRILDTAFENCDGLTEVSYAGSDLQWAEIMVWSGSVGYSWPMDHYPLEELFPREVTICYANHPPAASEESGTGEAVAPPEAGPGSSSTEPQSERPMFSVEVDGKRAALPTFALRDERGYETNYVRLRDLAALLNGTGAQFEVAYNGSVLITTGVPYTPDGTEGATPFTGEEPYQTAFAETRVDGRRVPLDAILLTDENWGGYTYYKLRDLGRALRFYVGWSRERGIYLETDRPYGE